MNEILNLSAEVAEVDVEAGSATVRVMPFGEAFQHQGELLQFDQGSIEFDGHAPVNIDHQQGVLDHIGKVDRYFEGPDGGYADITFSDTQAGRDARTLLLDGVITDVSAGIMFRRSDDSVDEGSGVRHRKGSLHHVAIVRTGAAADVGNGSKVLSVHSANEEVNEMAENETVTSEVAENEELVSLKADVTELRQTVAELSVPGSVDDRVKDMDLDTALRAVIFGGNPELAGHFNMDHSRDQQNFKRLQEFVLAKDNTTVGAGVVPDFAKSEVISIVDANRPINGILRKDSIGNYGMTIDYPIVATKPSVAVQSSQHAEPDSTQIDINTTAISLGTYAGASDVAVQLLERSFPGYLNVLFREYAHVLATQTEVVASDALIAGAGGTAVLADLSASLSATIAAVSTRKTAVLSGTRRPATHMIVGTTRWTQLESLADSTGRPMLHFGDGTNSLGSNAAPTFMGMEVVVSPDATATDCIIINADRSAVALESAPQLINVDIKGTSLSVQLGVYQYYACGVLYAAGIQTLTPS